jgi:hypothetical protein
MLTILATLVSIMPYDIKLRADAMVIDQGIGNMFFPEYSLSDALKHYNGRRVVLYYGVYNCPIAAINAHTDNNLKKITGILRCPCAHVNLEFDEWDDNSVKVGAVDFFDLLEKQVGKTLILTIQGDKKL